MFELKRIAVEAVPDAMEKAVRYRLLNEPLEAESICRDVLQVQPDHKEARVTLLLALTDQFSKDYGATRENALEVLSQMEGQYEQAYYEGIIEERWGKSQLSRGVPQSAAADWIRRAMRCYDRAEQLSPPDNPDATIRWNTCARYINSQAPTAERREERLDIDLDSQYGDDMPLR